METIQFKSIAGYEGYYEISNTGIVRSLDRTIVLKNGSTRVIKGRELKPKSNGRHLFVTLSKGGKSKNFYIHRLAAGAFIPNPELKPFVNHLDGIPQNNSSENLEWSTHAENTKHAYNNGLYKNKGCNFFMATGVIDNQLGMEFSTPEEWADARKINHDTARNIISGLNCLTSLDLSFLIIVRKRKSNGTK